MLKLTGLLIIFAVVWNLILVKDWVNSTDKLITPSTGPKLVALPSSTGRGFTSALPVSEGIGKVVDTALSGAKGDYAFVIKNLRTGEAYYYNDRQTFSAASLYKLWVMTITFQQISAGKLTLEDKISLDVAQQNEKLGLSNEEAEVSTGVLTITVKNALEQMITISHNYAAYNLVNKIGRNSMPQFLKDNNFSDSSWGTTPMTSARDIYAFYNKLYGGKLGDAETTKQMIELLKRQKKNDALPQGIPEGIDIGHKTGEIDYVKHDAGIVFAPNGDYIIVAMSESQFPGGAADRIGMVSEAVYKYFDQAK